MTSDEDCGPDERRRQATPNQAAETDPCQDPVSGASSESAPAAQLEGPWSSKRLTFWDQPFQVEEDVIKQFEGILLAVLAACEARPSLAIAAHVSSLKYARRRYQDFLSGAVHSSNAFLAPAFKAILPIAQALYCNRDDQAAAWMVNLFAEQGKILILRARSDYYYLFRDYLQLYCDLFEVNFTCPPRSRQPKPKRWNAACATCSVLLWGPNLPPRATSAITSPIKS